MRKIYTTTFVTLDGVMQAPGGNDEDRANGFAYGGWQINWNEPDEIAEKIMANLFSQPFDLLLGRKTYDMWAHYWPEHKDEPLVGVPFDKATKYVVSHEEIALPWSNSKLITGDTVEELKKLKNTDGPDLSVWGSSVLIQTLLEHHLIDHMHILTYPITIGTGKKLFTDGTQPQRFKQTEAQITSTGVVFATYEPAEPLKKG